MSTNTFDANEIKEEPGDDPNDVLFGSHYGVRTIELNRLNKMNALDSSMARKIILRLKVYIILLALCPRISLLIGKPFAAGMGKF